jgi:hypothetical protein
MTMFWRRKQNQIPKRHPHSESLSEDAGNRFCRNVSNNLRDFIT